MFRDRPDAGRRLAPLLVHLRNAHPVVVGLPRGGVPVAAEVAKALGAPLDVIVVRKLGVPFQPELGMGAIGEDGIRVVNDDVVRMAGVSDRQIATVEDRERVELERRATTFRAGRPRIPLVGRTVVVVDDGIATGSTARAACQVARAEGATHVVLAVPGAPPDWTQRLAGEADEMVCVETPDPFWAVGQLYRDFTQTTDREVVACLMDAATRTAATATPADPSSDHGHNDPAARDDDVAVDLGPLRLTGRLTVPKQPFAVVVFAHGSGSSRLSPRNRYVASVLNEAGIATLLFDLLTVHEEQDRRKVFDIEVLGRRLVDATRWLQAQPGFGALPIGYFGASTGAAAALVGAAELGDRIGAVVSRGGRPDLAGAALRVVTAPTLLIVGGRDHVVLELNRDAQAQLSGESHLEVVPGATHLFEEPGTLEAAARLATDWFRSHLAPAR